MTAKMVNEQRAETLFDLLAEGNWTSADIIVRTGWSYSQFLSAVQKLRDICAATGDVISVTAEPQGSREAWLYSLQAGKGIVDAEQSRWIINRLQDTERRVETIAHVLEVAVNSLDGRTLSGKKARIYHLHIKRAQEEVTLITGNAE